MEQVEHGEGAERAWEAAVTSWGWKEVVEAAGGRVGWATSQRPSAPRGCCCRPLVLWEIPQPHRQWGNVSSQILGSSETPEGFDLGHSEGKVQLFQDPGLPE